MKVTGIVPAWIWLRPKVIYAGEGKPYDPKGAALVVSNHISVSDPVSIMLLYWKRRFRFLATKDLFASKFKTALFNYMHCIKVDKDKFSLNTLREVTDALKGGEIVAIFPEGQLNGDTDTMLPFKTGAALMAYQGNAPILPVYLVPPRKKTSRQIIVVGDPIDLHEILGDDAPYREVKKMSGYLHEKEVALKAYYDKYYINGKKRKDIPDEVDA